MVAATYGWIFAEWRQILEKSKFWLSGMRDGEFAWNCQILARVSRGISPIAGWFWHVCSVYTLCDLPGVFCSDIKHASRVKVKITSVPKQNPWLHKQIVYPDLKTSRLYPRNDKNETNLSKWREEKTINWSVSVFGWLGTFTCVTC